MADAYANWEAIHEFLRIWDRPANLQGNREIAIIPCQLAYGARRKVQHVSTTCHIYRKSGKLNVMEKDWLNPFDYYAEFDVEWQTFSVTASQALRIDGQGPKLGHYWVEISPQISN